MTRLSLVLIIGLFVLLLGAGPAVEASTFLQWFGTIKSTQRGTIDMDNGTSKTATITSVDTSKTQLRWLGGTAAASGTFIGQQLVLTNSTTVTATAASASTGFVSWELTEYY
jgi:hypothetical protein